MRLSEELQKSLQQVSWHPEEKFPPGSFKSEGVGRVSAWFHHVAAKVRAGLSSITGNGISPQNGTGPVAHIYGNNHGVHLVVPANGRGIMLSHKPIRYREKLAITGCAITVDDENADEKSGEGEGEGDGARVGVYRTVDVPCGSTRDMPGSSSRYYFGFKIDDRGRPVQTFVVRPDGEIYTAFVNLPGGVADKSSTAISVDHVFGHCRARLNCTATSTNASLALAWGNNGSGENVELLNMAVPATPESLIASVRDYVDGLVGLQKAKPG